MTELNKKEFDLRDYLDDPRALRTRDERLVSKVSRAYGFIAPNNLLYEVSLSDGVTGLYENNGVLMSIQRLPETDILLREEVELNKIGNAIAEKVEPVPEKEIDLGDYLDSPRALRTRDGRFVQDITRMPWSDRYIVGFGDGKTGVYECDGILSPPSKHPELDILLREDVELDKVKDATPATNLKDDFGMTFMEKAKAMLSKEARMEVYNVLEEMQEGLRSRTLPKKDFNLRDYLDNIGALRTRGGVSVKSICRSTNNEDFWGYLYDVCLEDGNLFVYWHTGYLFTGGLKVSESSFDIVLRENVGTDKVEDAIADKSSLLAKEAREYTQSSPGSCSIKTVEDRIVLAIVSAIEDTGLMMEWPSKETIDVLRNIVRQELAIAEEVDLRKQLEFLQKQGGTTWVIPESPKHSTKPESQPTPDPWKEEPLDIGKVPVSELYCSNGAVVEYVHPLNLTEEQKEAIGGMEYVVGVRHHDELYPWRESYLCPRDGNLSIFPIALLDTVAEEEAAKVINRIKEDTNNPCLRDRILKKLKEIIQ